jgi:predicted nuclease of restriction endonuclease-like (RecB) superfamily
MSEMLLVAIFAGATEGTTSTVLEHRRRHLPLAGNVPIPTNRGGILLAQPDPANFLPDGVASRAHHPARSTRSLFTSSGALANTWSCYVRLLSVQNPEAHRFYEGEALRGGWTVRQLDRQIGSQFYERTALSKNKAAMLRKGQQPTPDDSMTPEEEIKDPFVLEFLNLKDECSESDLESALISKLETFLLELGGDFTFVGRQRRLRVGDAWYRIDLLFFHRRLRCLVIIDLKLDKLTHADAGQMHLYLNYARALDGRGREPAGRADPLCGEGQRRRALRA